MKFYIITSTWLGVGAAFVGAASGAPATRQTGSFEVAQAAQQLQQRSQQPPQRAVQPPQRTFQPPQRIGQQPQRAVPQQPRTVQQPFQPRSARPAPLQGPARAVTQPATPVAPRALTPPAGARTAPDPGRLGGRNGRGRDFGQPATQPRGVRELPPRSSTGIAPQDRSAPAGNRPGVNGPATDRAGARPETRGRAAVPPSGVQDANRPAPVDLRALQQQRRVTTQDNGRTRIIQEPGNRTIIRRDNQIIIRSDDSDRFGRFGDVQRLRRRDGSNVNIVNRPGGVQIVSVYDEYGRLVERRRRVGGRDYVLFSSDRRARGLAAGVLIAAPLVLAPLVLGIPRELYIVDYEDAPPATVYETFAAPPVQTLDRRYSVEEVLRNDDLRNRMRRVDLDSVNFASGSWEVPPAYMPRLQNAANAMLRLIERNPREIFLIEGYTDAIGSPEDNLTLSDRRAEAIAIVLTQQFKVPPENLLTQGYGEKNLKIDTQQAEVRNRRVAIRRVTPLLAAGK